MTRINLVTPSLLSRQHLVAEYRELPRAFGLAYRAYWRGDLSGPTEYVLGPGHVKFFYDKLWWLWKRHYALSHEMMRRRCVVNLHPCEVLAHWSDLIPEKQWGDWVPSAVEVNRSVARLNERGANIYYKEVA